MRSIPPTLPLLLAALACGRAAPDRLPAADSTPLAPAEAAAEPWTIRLDGVGPVWFGMALADARAALGDSLIVTPGGECGFTAPRGTPTGVRFMVEQGTELADSARRLIFETDGQRVVRYRAGVTPAVEYVEGCA